MTLTLTLTPEHESRLQTQAAQAGLALPHCLQQVIKQSHTLSSVSRTHFSPRTHFLFGRMSPVL